jgi:uncharacterized protein YacL
MMIRSIVRVVITLLFGGLGLYLNYHLDILSKLGWTYTTLLVSSLGMAAVFALLAFFICPVLMRACSVLIRWTDARLQKIPIQELFSGVIGVIIGLIIAALFSLSFISIPYFGPLLSLVLSLVLGYLGLSLGTKRKEEVLSFFNLFARLRDKGEKGEKNKEDKLAQKAGLLSGYKVLDTSVIIDGRIADIVKTGFIEGTLLIPSFVLEELRHIADSSDLLKRNRGRRGLDILKQVQKESVINVEIREQDFEDITEVDSKLVRLGQTLGCPLLTNDYNLNKVAELQGVQGLNINELANAVKPIVLPGEEMQVQVMKEGKEPGQGVAYLDDGTMIVVDTGRRYIGQNITVLVTSVLQTAAGRMIFAKPKAIAGKKTVDFTPNEVDAFG